MHIEQNLVEYYDCESNISDELELYAVTKLSIEKLGAKVVNSETVNFVPHGLTLVFILEESHVVLSTWPEYRLLLADVLLCNADMSPCVLIDALEKNFCKTGRVVRHTIPRFIGNTIDLDRTHQKVP